MKIMVTGGAGFIGSHLTDALIAEGHDVVAIDNLALGREANIDHLKSNPHFRFIRQDLLAKSAVERIFAAEKCDAVFHFAANSDIAASHSDPSIDLDNTFLTTANVLAAMRANGVNQIVFPSTSAVYGEASRTLSEDSGPLFPVSHYGAAKLASEAFISSHVANYGFKAWVLRFPNVIGERTTHGVIFDFIRKLQENPGELVVLGDGEQNKPYLYVRDLVAAVLFVWKNASSPLNCFNIGVASRTKVKDIARIVIAGMGLHSEIRFTGGARGWIGDVPAFDYDLSKIHALGWKAEKSSDDAVRMAVHNVLKSQAGR